MDARICSNPTCRTILPQHTCTLCGTATEPLPSLNLAPIGIDGTAKLTHTFNNGYAIVVKTRSGRHLAHITLADLLQSSQPHLPNVHEAGGLMIMDAVKTAARLIRTKNTGHWSGWVTYLIEILQGYTDAATFHQVLVDLSQAVSSALTDQKPPPDIQSWNSGPPRPSDES
ncbi:hypothetical protein ES703_88676 [subsurface metagenome]